jgi:hypothetical protein
MKIYFAHSKRFDYESEYYKPIEESLLLKQHELIFPHKPARDSYYSRDFYRDLDLVIAEVSYPGTGLGIEIGWVYDDNTPIYCFHRKGADFSSSLRSATDNIIEYDSIEEMVSKIESIVNELN